MNSTKSDAKFEASVREFYEHPAEEDPTTLFSGLLKRPAFKSQLGFWIVSNYADIKRILRSHSAIRTPPKGGTSGSELHHLFKNFLTNLPPDDHQRVRGIVRRTFTPKSVQQLQAYAESAAAEAVARGRSQGQLDLCSEFAGPLPVAVMAMLFGIPKEDGPIFSKWMSAILIGLSPGISSAAMSEAEEAAKAYMEYMRAAIGRRSHEPEDDLLSALIHASEDSNRLTEAEVIGAACHIFLAGVETTASFIPNLIVELLTSSNGLAKLRQDVSLIPATVEEGLRYVTPVVAQPMRIASRDFSIAQQVIHAGEDVHLWLGAANRDPDIFDEPDIFDIERSPNPHLAFSTGINFCLGAHLARMESAVALGALIRGTDSVTLADQELRYHDSATIWGLESAVVACA